MRYLICALLACSACAHDIAARFPGDNASPGSLTFTFTQAPSDVSVAVDGMLLVDDAHAGRIHIDNVPAGSHDVVVADGPEEKSLKVWIDYGKETTVPLGSPGSSPIDGWRSAFVSLFGIVLYCLLR